MTRYAFGQNHGWGHAFEADGASAEGGELDGLRIVFDQRVGLHPANLQKATAPKRPPVGARPAMPVGRHVGVQYGRR